MPFFSLAQLQDFKEVTKLPPGINSNFEESMPLLSPDGRTLYFTRMMDPENTGGEFSGSDVWASRWDPTIFSWGKASNKALSINTKANNTLVGMNRKGDVLYVLNTWGIYFTSKSGNSWSKPELINIPDFRTDGFVGVFVSPDYDVVFISMNGKDSHGEEDLYVSLKDAKGKWSRPKNLGATINTNGFEISPFLSEDKKKLYFASNGHPGIGDADIFVSERLYESWEVWSAPQNLGDKINSKYFDAFFSTYGDSVAYFCSNREGKSADIFTSVVYRAAGPVKKEVVRQYLTNQEVANLGGIQTSLYFEVGTNDLNESQKQVLGKVGVMLLEKKDIRCTLIALKDPEITDLEIYEKRLLGILGFLKKSGVEGSRITFGIEKLEKASPKDKEPVRIRFYR